MKILHVVELFSGGGGLENVVKNILLTPQKKEIKQSVCVLDKSGYLGKTLREKGFDIYDLYRLQEKKRDIRVINNLRKIIKDQQIDVVHTHNFVPLYFTTLATLFLNLKIIVTFHGFIDWTLKKWLFYNFFFPRFKVVIVNSTMKQTYSFLNLFFKKKITTIINGIDIKAFNREPETDLRAQLNISKSDFVFGSIGRLSPVKNQMLQLRTIAKLKESIKNLKLLLITGGSPDSSDLKDRLLHEAERLDVKENLILLDFRKDVPDLLKIMDVFFMTSLTEGSSLALLEAMASGLPVVASNVGGNKEIVQDRINGFLFDLENEDELTMILMKLFTDEDFRKTMGDAALKSAQNYSTERMVKQYSNMYERV